MIDDPNAEIVMSSKCPPHNHPPVTEATLASKFSRILKNKVYSCPETPTVQLYGELCKRFPQYANCLPRNIALMRMQRYRRKYKLAHVQRDGDPLLCPSPTPVDDQSPQSSELKMKAGGATIYVDHHGFHYQQQDTTANKRQLRCAKGRILGIMCPARASMDLEPRYSLIKMTRDQHNHPPPDASNTVFVYNLRTRAREEPHKSLQLIYDEEAKRNPDAAAVLAFAKVKSTMLHARRSLSWHSSSTLPNVSCSSFVGELDANVKDTGRSEVEDDCAADGSKSGCAKASTSPSTALPGKTAVVPGADPVPMVEVVVSDREGSALEEMVLYQCPYCQKLFDEDEPLEQHILTSHINMIVPGNNMWDETQSAK